jgi:hypothetical protein
MKGGSLWGSGLAGEGKEKVLGVEQDQSTYICICLYICIYIYIYIYMKLAQ